MGPDEVLPISHDSNVPIGAARSRTADAPQSFAEIDSGVQQNGTFHVMELSMVGARELGRLCRFTEACATSARKAVCTCELLKSECRTETEAVDFVDEPRWSHQAQFIDVDTVDIFSFYVSVI